MSRYSQQRSQSLLRHGYTRDAQGHLSVDPNNEYGGYQQMLRTESGQTKHLERAQHASGWGEGSGYLGAQTDELQHAQGGEQAAFGQDFENELAGINQGEQDAGYTRDQALYQAQLEAAQSAINDGNFNPADFGGIDVPYGDQSNPGAGGEPPAHDVHQRGRAGTSSTLSVRRHEEGGANGG